MNLNLVLTLFAGLVGLPALWSVVIDLLKFAGIVQDGNAGMFNAAFSMLSLLAIAIAVNYFPQVNIPSIDASLIEIAKFAGLLLSFLTQIFVAKGTHSLTKRIIPSLSFGVG